MALSLNFGTMLSKRGQQYFDILKEHTSHIGIMEIDDIELAMLANEYDLYFTNMEFCQQYGYSFVTGSNNGYSQIRPEFTVMKNAYQNILKHSPKFGMNPADRAKLFNISKNTAKKEKKFEL